MAIEKYEVRNRWSNEVQFTAEIDCAPDTAPRIKLGLAIRWAAKARADLSGADLTGAYLSRADLSDADLSGADLTDADLSGADLTDADLSGADLSGADLSGAYLSGADLTDADLSDVDLRPIKADFWMILAMARREVPALIGALRDGKVDGSTYEGDCACLVGSLENAGAKGLPHIPSSPAERWFSPIRSGDKPDGEGEGPYRARTALAWALEFCAVIGIDPDGEPIPPAAQAEAA